QEPRRRDRPVRRLQGQQQLHHELHSGVRESPGSRRPVDSANRELHVRDGLSHLRLLTRAAPSRAVAELGVRRTNCGMAWLGPIVRTLASAVQRPGALEANDPRAASAINPVRENQAMSDVSGLLQRIDAEFSSLQDKIKKAQTEKVQEHQDRQQRLAAFEKT